MLDTYVVYNCVRNMYDGQLLDTCVVDNSARYMCGGRPCHMHVCWTMLDACIVDSGRYLCGGGGLC